MKTEAGVEVWCIAVLTLKGIVIHENRRNYHATELNLDLPAIMKMVIRSAIKTWGNEKYLSDL